MNYTEFNHSAQAFNAQNGSKSGVLFYNSGLNGFLQDEASFTLAQPKNFGTSNKPRIRDLRVTIFPGHLLEQDQICPQCGQPMVKSGLAYTTLNHLPFGGYTKIKLARTRYRCLNSACSFSTFMNQIPFKEAHHRITLPLKSYVQDLLNWGFNLKSVAFITGLDKMTVKDIHKELLQKKFTVNGQLIKPEKQAKYLAIDEFKLHNGYKYATAIIDWDSGHILYLSHGKKKQVVYDFIKHVGLKWMSHVKAVACDMNSDFEEAFKEKCPGIDIVYDHFHIIKNFNDKVAAPIRKDEQRRLIEEKRYKEAKDLKHTKYILLAKRSTLRQKDQDALAGKLVAKAGKLFNQPEVKAHGGNENKYNELLKENKLFMTIDLVKEQLDAAYQSKEPAEMCVRIQEIIDICRETGNQHFLWFARLLGKHLTGIFTYAKHHISTGRLEGLNNKIKTERRKGYGYPDDEYFFLRLMAASRRKAYF